MGFSNSSPKLFSIDRQRCITAGYQLHLECVEENYRKGIRQQRIKRFFSLSRSIKKAR